MHQSWDNNNSKKTKQQIKNILHLALFLHLDPKYLNNASR